MSDERKPLWTDDDTYAYVDHIRFGVFLNDRIWDVVESGYAEALATDIRDEYEAALAERDERIRQLEAQVETLELMVDGYKLDIKDLRTDLAAYTTAYNARSPHGSTRTRKKGSHE